MRAIFDTGSTNTWIINPKTDLGHDFKKSYDTSKSSTFKKLDKEIKAVVPFGIGDLVGHFVSDTLTIGDSGGNKITIPNSTIGVVDRSRGIFENPDMEAIVGLAYPGISVKGTKGLVQAAGDQKIVKENVFAFYCDQSFSGKSGSYLTFGGYDTSKFTGDIKWYPVLYKWHYNIKLDDIKFNGKAANICPP